MAFWLVVAGLWLVTAFVITLAFLGAKRSPLLYRWLFGQKPSAEVHQLVIAHPAAKAEVDTRLVA